MLLKSGHDPECFAGITAAACNYRRSAAPPSAATRRAAPATLKTQGCRNQGRARQKAIPQGGSPRVQYQAQRRVQRLYHRSGDRGGRQKGRDQRHPGRDGRPKEQGGPEQDRPEVGGDPQESHPGQRDNGPHLQDRIRQLHGRTGPRRGQVRHNPTQRSTASSTDGSGSRCPSCSTRCSRCPPATSGTRPRGWSGTGWTPCWTRDSSGRSTPYVGASGYSTRRWPYDGGGGFAASRRRSTRPTHALVGTGTTPIPQAPRRLPREKRFYEAQMLRGL